jgi:tetratricopeptide (TPR) repeat protein
MLLSTITVLLLAQTPSFEDLARRAEAVLDSQPAEAAALYRQALALRPDWAEGWFYLGGAYYQLDRYAEATDAFRKVVARAPRNGPAWAFLGLAEAELDDSQQAVEDMRKGEALGLGGNQRFEVAVRVKAAQTLVRSSTFDEALAQLQPLSTQNEDSPAVVDTMGLCALAMPYYLPELSPERRAAVRMAGKAAWDSVSQRPAEAAAGYRELLAKYPNEPGVHYAMALYLMETDLSAALGEAQKEVENNPGHWPALLLLTSLQIREGAPELALKTLAQALKVVPSKYRWLCHAELGRANLTADNLDAAIPELAKAARLTPSNAQVRFLLSQAYRRAGRAADAQREFDAFQKLKLQEDPLGVGFMRPFSFTGKN